MTIRGRSRIQTMKNPGLKQHTPFLIVASRRTTADNPPPMARPKTKGNGAGYGPPPEPETIRENMTTPPPAMSGGGSSIPPVGVENGDEAPASSSSSPLTSTLNGDTPTLLNSKYAGVPESGAPLDASVPPSVSPASKQRRIDTQKQVGGGQHENPAYDEAQDDIREKVQLRRTPGLQRARTSALYPTDRPHLNELGLQSFQDTDFPPGEGRPSRQPMMDVKDVYEGDDPEQGWDGEGFSSFARGGCETCYLKHGDGWHDPGVQHDHEKKPFSMGAGERFSALYPVERSSVNELGLDVFRDSDFPDNGPQSRYQAQPMFDLKDVYDYDDPNQGWDAPSEQFPSKTSEGCETCWLKNKTLVHQHGHTDHPFKPFAGQGQGRYSSWQNNPAAQRGEIVQRGGSEEDNLTTFIDPHHRPDPNYMWGQHGDQPMIDFKPQYSQTDPEQMLDYGYGKPSGQTCETCYLKTGDEESPVGEDHEFLYGLDHPFKPLKMEPGQRYSSHLSDDDEYWEGSDYPSPGPCPHCGSDSVDGVPGRSYCHECGHTDTPQKSYGPLNTRDFSVWDQAMVWGDHGKPGVEEVSPGFGRRTLKDIKEEGPGDITPLRMQHLNSHQEPGRPPKIDSVKAARMLQLRSLGPKRCRWPNTGRQPTGIDVFPGEHLTSNGKHASLVLMKINHPLHQAASSEDDDDPRGEVENLISSLPEAGKAMTPEDRPWTLPTMAQEKALQDAGFEIHHEHVGDGWVPQKYWVRQQGENDQYIAPSRDEPRGGYWETSIGPRNHWAGESDEEVRPTIHTTFDNAYQRMTDPDTWYRENQADQDAEMWNRGKRQPGKMKPFVPTARPVNPGLQSLNSWDMLENRPEGFSLPEHYRNHGLDVNIDPDTNLAYLRDLSNQNEHGVPRGNPSSRQMFSVQPDYYIPHDRSDDTASPGEEVETESYRGDRFSPDTEPCADCWVKDSLVVPKWEHEFLGYSKKHPWRGLDKSELKRFGKAQETDEEFWARQPDVVEHMPHADAARQEFDDEPYRDPDIDWDEEDLDLPEHVSLREHAGLVRGGMKWDGATRYPSYTSHSSRAILDSDGNPGYADEGHVIEHNTHNYRPVLVTDDHDEPAPHPLQFPWTHSYYPAGQTDDEGLVRGYNTAEQALRAKNQLSLWGARHPRSKELLKGYQYIGSELPYDPSVQLPHEKRD